MGDISDYYFLGDPKGVGFFDYLREPAIWIVNCGLVGFSLSTGVSVPDPETEDAVVETSCLDSFLGELTLSALERPIAFFTLFVRFSLRAAIWLAPYWRPPPVSNFVYLSISILPPVITQPIFYPGLMTPCFTRFLMPPRPNAPVGSTIILHLSPKNFMFSISTSSGTLMTLVKCFLMIGRLRIPIWGVEAPSAIVVWLLTEMISFYYKESSASLKPPGSHPWIKQFGYKCLEAIAQPEIKPPPPIPMRRWSIWPTCSCISLAIVP